MMYDVVVQVEPARGRWQKFRKVRNIATKRLLTGGWRLRCFVPRCLRAVMLMSIFRLFWFSVFGHLSFIIPYSPLFCSILFYSPLVYTLLYISLLFATIFYFSGDSSTYLNSILHFSMFLFFSIHFFTTLYLYLLFHTCLCVSLFFHSKLSLYFYTFPYNSPHFYTFPYNSLFFLLTFLILSLDSFPFLYCIYLNT